MKAALLLAALLGAGQASAQTVIPPDVQAVIDRSRATRANYTVILVAEVVRNGQGATETNAEFQQGAMHRVEVPSTRVLANCDTGASTTLDIGSNWVSHQDERASACGIDVDADPVISARRLPPVAGPYGRADVIELTGANFVRRYAVTADGIIVVSDYLPRRPDVGFSLRTLSAAVTRGPQDPAMFSEESLARSFAQPPAPER